MNILFLTDKIDYVSGVAKHLFYLSDELLKNGEDNVYLICAGGEMKEEFVKSGVIVVEYPKLSFDRRSKLNFFLSFLFIVRFCRMNKISILHSHTHYTANLGHFASKLLRIRSVQTIHGLIPAAEGKLPHFRADLYIAFNKQILNRLVNSGIKNKKIFLIGQGVPVYIGPEEKVKPLKVLCASRLIYEKGIDIFIDALSKISSQLNTETEFIVAGEGEYKNDLEKLAEQKGVKVKFIGKLNDLNPALAESHIFVFPSRIKTEGFPVVLIEAGMNENMIITSNFDSLNEIAEPDIDCLVFHNENYDDLAEKLLSAINNYDNLTYIAENWKKKCYSNFTAEIMADKTKQVYLK